MAMFTLPAVDCKYTFWANLLQKTQNCQFKLKSGTETNSNSIIKLAFFRFQPEIPFLGKFGPKNQNY